MYCEGSKTLDNGTYEFETKSWGPPDLSLQNIAYQLQQQVWREGYGEVVLSVLASNNVQGPLQ